MKKELELTGFVEKRGEKQYVIVFEKLTSKKEAEQTLELMTHLVNWGVKALSTKLQKSEVQKSNRKCKKCS